MVTLVGVKSILDKSEGFTHSRTFSITWLEFLEQLLVMLYVAEVRMRNKEKLLSNILVYANIVRANKLLKTSVNSVRR